MDNVSINVDELNSEKEKIIVEKKKLETILKELNNNTDFLKDCWKSETSDKLFSDYNEFKKHLEDLIELFNNDIKFIDDNVISKYREYEDIKNKDIDEKIAI